MRNPKVIVITGASSGLGAAMAKSYAQEGIILGLLARDQQRLNEVIAYCQDSGAKVHSASMDVTDADTMQAWLLTFDDAHPVDCIIANAGVSAGSLGGEGADQAKKVMDINFHGVINTIYPLMDRMRQRKSGQLALVSSLAGFVALSSSPAYSASKAAVRMYGEALRGLLAPFNIGVTVITPGYIKTPMTDINDYPMPGLMEADAAAELIKRKLKTNPIRIGFGFWLYTMTRLIGILPPWLRVRMLSNLPGKPNFERQGKE